jgi:hypothetical protein
MSTSTFNSHAFTNSSNTPTSSFFPSKARLWTGRVLYGLILLFLTFDTGIKLAMTPQAIEGSIALGFTAQHVFVIGWIALGCLVISLIPRTRIFGALLWTAYFGGTVVTHLRLGNPLFTHILFGVYICVLMWIALYLFDSRVATILEPAHRR